MEVGEVQSNAAFLARSTQGRWPPGLEVVSPSVPVLLSMHVSFFQCTSELPPKGAVFSVPASLSADATCRPVADRWRRRSEGATSVLRVLTGTTLAGGDTSVLVRPSREPNRPRHAELAASSST